MFGDIVQRFLHNAIEVNGHVAVQVLAASVLFVADADAGLFFETRQIQIQCAFQTGVVEHHGMQHLRQRANFVERGLHDVAHFI